MRRIKTGDIIYGVTERTNSSRGRRFQASVELACLPGRPYREGNPKPTEKEARESAARAVLNDPLLHCVFAGGKPAQELRELVLQKIGRVPKSKDIVYANWSLGSPEESRFKARVELGCFEGKPAWVGEERSSATAAKRSAAEAVLCSDEGYELLKPEPPGPTSIGLLVEKVQMKLRRPPTKEDIVYSVKENKTASRQNRWRASVQLACFNSTPSALGSFCPSPKKARQSAAEALQEDRLVHALLSKDTISSLRQLVDKKLLTQTKKEDVVYTVSQDPETMRFTAVVELAGLGEGPVRRQGVPRPTKREAKFAAADAVLSDAKVQQWFS